MITNTTRRFWAFFILLISSLYSKKATRRLVVYPLIVLFLGMLIPQKIVIPVESASPSDWNEKSFWAYPWGSSITHKGIDIFKSSGTPVLSATHGIVVYTSIGGKGGNAVMILGPKWRFHYYAHLKEIKTFAMKPVSSGSVIGSVGNTGNAKGKPPHLHYSITSPIPYPQRWDSEAIQGWKKIFYLNPDDYLRN